MLTRLPMRSPQTVKLNLVPLEERAVPATLVDLTNQGNEGLANEALFRQHDAQPTGSGHIRSFLRVHANGVQEGYNTDARPLELDENSSPQFTRSLRLSEVPLVTIGGIAYREFLLDINQRASSPLLSLDELRIYTAASGNLTGYNGDTKELAGLTARFDLDADGDASVRMNYRLNPGSGGGDVLVFIPNAVFQGSPGSDFIYLYSKFGGATGEKANAGFEEWAVREAVRTPTNTASLSGRVYADLDGSISFSAGDVPLANIEIMLFDANGTQLCSAFTDADGFYEFKNLPAGTYSVEEVDILDDEYYDYGASLGTVNGVANGTLDGDDKITGIILNPGDIGIYYDFLETLTEPNPN